MYAVLYHNNTLLCSLAALILTVLGPQFCKTQAQTPADEPPSLQTTLAAYELIEPWIRDMAVPEGAGGPDLVGACITLRFDGRVMGTGTVFGGGTQSLPYAVHTAIAKAKNRLPVVEDAMYEERLRLAAEQMTISLELAGAGLPVGESSYLQISALFQPGRHGVALRIDEYAGAIYPEEMLYTSQEAGGALKRLISDMTGDASLTLRPLQELLEQSNISVLRFRTRQVAQLAPRGEPRLIQRGGKVIASGAVNTMPAINEWTDGIAGFLIDKRSVGTYLPVNDTTRSTATPFEAALRMYVLLRYASVTQDDDSATLARDEADSTSQALLAIMQSGQDIGAPASALLGVSLTLLQKGDADLVETLSGYADDIESFSEPERPMIAWALAEMGQTEKANAIMPVCRRVDRQGSYPSRMPWLGFAELRLAGDGDIASALALREMRRRIWEFQITHADTEGLSPDLQGGIVFTSSRNPAPTWSAARPLSFVAAMLGDRRLTDAAELPKEMSKLFDSMRFLRQLSAGEHEGHMYRSRDAAMWGVRAAVWDQAMPIPASCMTLLTLCELIESLEALQSASTPEQP